MSNARHTGFARLTQKDVSTSAARHEMLYSGRVGGARAVFAFCDLSGLDLSGRNLADADFTGAIMEAGPSGRAQQRPCHAAGSPGCRHRRGGPR